MKIYIPQHLLKLPLLANLSAMIRAYAEERGTEGEWKDNWIDRNDPVIKFLRLVITEDMIDTSTQSLDDVIVYISKLFYSVKGTSKVFEYIKRYLGLDIVGDIKYSVDSLSLRISNVSQTDETNFSTSLQEFLEALLYFREFHLEMDGVEITIQSSISNNVGGDSLTYSVFSPEIMTL